MKTFPYHPADAPARSGVDTRSTYVRPSGSHLPFYVRRTLIAYIEKIQTWVDIFSLPCAFVTGQCHSQFEMDRKKTFVVFLKLFGSFRVNMGFPNPVSKQTIRQSSHQSCVIFFIWRQNANRNKINNCQYWETCWRVSHFIPKRLNVCALRYCFFCHAVCRR